MIMMQRLTAVAIVLAAAALAPVARGQSAPTAPAVQYGPSVPGLCVFSRDGLIAGSTVGKAVVERLNQLGQQVQSELSAQQTSLQNDVKALNAAKASLSTDQFNTRAAALTGRERDFERLVELRRQEMAQTQQKRFNEVLTDAQPVMQQVFQQHNCSVLVDGQSVLAVAPAMDLTPQVIQGLNTRITQLTFEREHLDQASGQ
jgi:Skp family chaperone for outer membrane proteins